MWPFSRPKKPAYFRNDVFWLTDATKIRGLVSTTSRHLAAGSHVLLITHSPATIERLAEAASLANLPLDGLDAAATAPHLQDRLLAQPAPTALLALASSLLPSTPPPTAPTALPRLHILIAERAPLRARDDAITAFAAALNPTAIEFHLSADDPLLKAFRGNQTTSILRSLGMKDDDSIVHPMLTRSLERAQQRVAERCPDPAQADRWLADQLRKPT